jgi:hypothetical protein
MASFPVESRYRDTVCSLLEHSVNTLLTAKEDATSNPVQALLDQDPSLPVPIHIITHDFTRPAVPARKSRPMASSNLLGKIEGLQSGS